MSKFKFNAVGADEVTTKPPSAQSSTNVLDGNITTSNVWLVDESTMKTTKMFHYCEERISIRERENNAHAQAAESSEGSKETEQGRKQAANFTSNENFNSKHWRNSIVEPNTTVNVGMVNPGISKSVRTSFTDERQNDEMTNRLMPPNVNEQQPAKSFQAASGLEQRFLASSTWLHSTGPESSKGTLPKYGAKSLLPEARPNGGINLNVAPTGRTRKGGLPLSTPAFHKTDRLIVVKNSRGEIEWRHSNSTTSVSESSTRHQSNSSS